MTMSKPWMDPPSLSGKAFFAASILDIASSAERAVATEKRKMRNQKQGERGGKMKPGQPQECYGRHMLVAQSTNSLSLGHASR
mmetsp:Transcript_2881/g.7319  ORF Transcript_2881/g.7319 Transcript_2881/m.7319 type:complete len:83 (-) Transcript_2881:209-457(-)